MSGRYLNEKEILSHNLANCEAHSINMLKKVLLSIFMISEGQRRGNVMRRAICNSNVEFASLCVDMSRRKFETLFFKFKSVVQHHLNIILNIRKRI